MVLFPYFFDNSTIAHRYLNLLPLILWYYYYLFLKENHEYKKIKKIINITIFFAIITSCITIYNLIANPYISRSIKSSGEYSINLSKKGIGGYSLIYSMCILGIYSLIKLKIHDKNKFIYLFIYLLSLVLMVLSNYFTALLIFIFSSIISAIFIKKEKSSIRKIIEAFLLFIFIFLIFNDDFMNFLISVFLKTIPNNGKTYLRLLDIKNSFASNLIDLFLDDRGNSITMSLNNCMKNPFFGIVFSKMKMNDGYYVGFGQHSHILDTFALYGLFVGFIYFILLIFPFINEFKKYNKNIVLLIVSIIMLSIFIFNNGTDAIAFSLFLAFPTLFDNKLKYENRSVKL